MLWSFDGGFGFDFDFLWGSCGSSTIEFDVVGWLDASTVLTFGNVDFFLSAGSFNVGLRFRVALRWLAVAMIGKQVSSCLSDV